MRAGTATLVRGDSSSADPEAEALLERAWPRIVEVGGSALVGDRVVVVIGGDVVVLPRRAVLSDIMRATLRPCPWLASPPPRRTLLAVVVTDAGIVYSRLRELSAEAA